MANWGDRPADRREISRREQQAKEVADAAEERRVMRIWELCMGDEQGWDDEDYELNRVRPHIWCKVVDSYETLRGQVAPVAERLYGASSYALDRVHAEDSRKALSISIRGSGEIPAPAELIERLSG